MIKQNYDRRKEPYHFVAIEENGRVVVRESYTLLKAMYNDSYISVRIKGDKERLLSLIRLRNKNRTDYRAFRNALENSDFETESGEKYFDEEKERDSFLDEGSRALKKMKKESPYLAFRAFIAEEEIRQMYEIFWDKIIERFGYEEAKRMIFEEHEEIEKSSEEE